MCVCVWEREREKERGGGVGYVCVSVCMCGYDVYCLCAYVRGALLARVCVCVCECVCVWVSVCVCLCVWVCLCLCVCVLNKITVPIVLPQPQGSNLVSLYETRHPQCLRVWSWGLGEVCALKPTLWHFFLTYFFNQLWLSSQSWYMLPFILSDPNMQTLWNSPLVRSYHTTKLREVREIRHQISFCCCCFIIMVVLLHVV